MSFTLKCDECDNEIKLKTGHIYNDGEEIAIDIGPVGDDGAEVICQKCSNCIRINDYN